MIYSFTAQAYEIAKPSLQIYKNFNLLVIDSYKTEFFNTETNEDENGNLIELGEDSDILTFGKERDFLGDIN